MVTPDWPPELQEQWQRIAEAVEEPCGACRGGTLRLYRVTRKQLVWAVFADTYTAITRCDQCGIEFEQSATVTLVHRMGLSAARFPQERD